MDNGDVKKHDSLSPPDINKGDPNKRTPIKPAKTLNRVPRACNACRKQKMKCEGAENPPCKRCRHNGLECLFEKPSREGTLTGEAGLERIRSLESQVADIRNSQVAIQTTLVDLVSHLRNPPSSPGFNNHSPVLPFHTPVNASSPGRMSHLPHPPPGSIDPHLTLHAPTPTDVTMSNSGGVLPPILNPNSRSQHRSGPGAVPGVSYPQQPGRDHHALDPAYASNRPPGTSFSHPQMPPPHPPGHPASLPPISSLHDMPPPPPRHAQSSRDAGLEGVPRRSRGSHGQSRSGGGTKGPSSAVTSADSSDDEGGAAELPASGLVAPWEVLRGLAEAAAERAAKENGDPDSITEPASRAYSASPGLRSADKPERPAKRRKVAHGPARPVTWPDVVTKRIISEQEARDLFKIFYDGCSTFLPVFDSRVDTFDALHERSPFAVDCICMVAAKVRDGGGPPSETYMKCLEEVQSISCKTLFSPVSRKEAVQAMILVSGWSDNGWLSGGHAVRMALELGMHRAWPKLLKRMKAGKMTTGNEDRELVISARAWFCLYLFEHQMSFGTGRPAILREDESVTDCRFILNHPLSIEDDMRLVSTVELMIFRERVQNKLGAFEVPLSDNTYATLRDAEATFKEWYEMWDEKFSKHYGDANFYRQSLQIQQYFAELFHNATALRGIKGPEDVARMPPAQRHIAVKSIQVAKLGLNICLRSPSYREGLKYAVHYTHMTATFAASFLLRLARLFPDDCDIQSVMEDVEELANILSTIPAGRYARTLRIMLHAKRKTASQSPELERVRPAVRPPSESAMSSAPYDRPAVSPPDAGPQLPLAPNMGVPAMYPAAAGNWDYLMRGFEPVGPEVPVWLSESNLGDVALSQQGLEAFLVPVSYDQRTQIW